MKPDDIRVVAASYCTPPRDEVWVRVATPEADPGRWSIRFAFDGVLALSVATQFMPGWGDVDKTKQFEEFYRIEAAKFFADGEVRDGSRLWVFYSTEGRDGSREGETLIVDGHHRMSELVPKRPPG